MKKHTEKQPIDDLFAKRLSSMSLPPGADSFDRLQVRMGQQKPEARVVGWRNSAVQRYTAAAACFILLCLVGWLYWPSGTKRTSNESQTAIKHNVPLRLESRVEKQSGTPVDVTTSGSEITDPLKLSTGQKQLASAGGTSVTAKNKSRTSVQSVSERDAVSQPEGTIRNKTGLVQTKSIDNKVNAAVVLTRDVTPVSQSVPESIGITDNVAAKASSPVERVLVVTIEEPAALVVARLAAKAVVDEKTMVEVTDKPEKEPKESGLWKQVKRFRQDELFVRSDKGKHDDRGLLSRAYDGLKHSLDKDKSAKQ